MFDMCFVCLFTQKQHIWGLKMLTFENGFQSASFKKRHREKGKTVKM